MVVGGSGISFTAGGCEGVGGSELRLLEKPWRLRVWADESADDTGAGEAVTVLGGGPFRRSVR